MEFVSGAWMFETFGELVATMKVGGQRTMVVLFTNFTCVEHPGAHMCWGRGKLVWHNQALRPD